MEWNFLTSLIIFATGIVSGIINVLAGGGSILSVPLLIFLGLPATVANGTNRVAILFQCASAIAGYKKNKVLCFSKSILFIIPALIGAIVGSIIGVYISDVAFKKIFAIVIVVSSLSMFIKRTPPNKKAKKSALVFVIFFLVGIYGGFIQVGVGFVIILALTFFSNFELKEINVIKVTIVFSYTIIAVITFSLGGKVHWIAAILLSCGSSIGGWMGSELALKINDIFIKLLILAMGTGFAVRLLFFS